MISIRELRKEFMIADGRVAALKRLDLEVAEGEFFVIVGASGSGKTTLLRCVAGLETPDGGEIRVGDRTVFGEALWVPPQDRNFGMVFQSYAVWPHLTVFDNVALPLREGARKIPRRQVRDRVREALRMVQLDQQADRPSTLLSGGQQQRVALARAIAVNPKVLLMDEPLSNLDARLREEVRGRIRELAKQLGATVLYVTHDQVEAMAMADRIALLSLGDLLQYGAPMDLYRNPECAEVAEFFGSVNWLPGRRVDHRVVETGIGRFEVSGGAVPGRDVLIGFRPESMAPAAPSDPRTANTFEARLVSSVFLGDQFVYEVTAGNEQRLTGKSRTAPATDGERLHLHVPPGNVMVFPADDRNTAFASPAEH